MSLPVAELRALFCFFAVLSLCSRLRDFEIVWPIGLVRLMDFWLSQKGGLFTSYTYMYLGSLVHRCLRPFLAANENEQLRRNVPNDGATYSAVKCNKQTKF